MTLIVQDGSCLRYVSIKRGPHIPFIFNIVVTGTASRVGSRYCSPPGRFSVTFKASSVLHPIGFHSRWDAHRELLSGRRDAGESPGT